jgi:hypothetical protein
MAQEVIKKGNEGTEPASIENGIVKETKLVSFN